MAKLYTDLIKKYSGIFYLLFGIALGSLFFALADNSLFGREPSAAPELVSSPVSFEINSRSHVRGSAAAPLTLVVFNDFTCPYCKEYMKNLEIILNEYPDDIFLVWKHFPLKMNDLSVPIASECADAEDKFWQYLQALNYDGDDYSREFLISSAIGIGLDSAVFTECLDSDKYRAKVSADYYEGIIKGVIGSPATFINGEYIPGAIPPDELRALISNQL